MSLKVNRDSIFFILPESRYSVSNRIDGYMEEDFTLHITAKIEKESLTQNQSFMIARNGMHSGVSAFKDEFGNYNAVFTYWFKDENDTPIPKQLFKQISPTEIDDFNEYSMVCDHYEERKIFCYYNGTLVGTLEYGKDDKQSYEHAFYWFGCGSMIGPEEHRAYGDFEYKLCFLLNKKLDIIGVQDIIDNYKDKYSHIVFNDLRKLNYDYPLRKHFAFFCDFDQHNRYKVWDLSFSGNYPQFYIEHNIYF